jgi:hypothetical protein
MVIKESAFALNAVLFDLPVSSLLLLQEKKARENKKKTERICFFILQ